MQLDLFTGFVQAGAFQRDGGRAEGFGHHQTQRFTKQRMIIGNQNSCFHHFGYHGKGLTGLIAEWARIGRKMRKNAPTAGGIRVNA